MSGTIKSKDQKILCTKSGNRCGMPDCRKILVVDETANDPASLVAEMAHIRGEKPGAARYDASMSDIERNAHPNPTLLTDALTWNLVIVCHRDL